GQLDPGPLWFVEVLLLFSVVAAVTLGKAPAGSSTPLRMRYLVSCAMGVAIVSFVIRLRFRIDSSQVGSIHLWQWGQCAGLFILGIAAGGNGGLPAVPGSIRRGCAVAATAGMVAVVAMLVLFRNDLDPLGGGWHWQSMIIAALEGIVCVS